MPQPSYSFLEDFIMQVLEQSGLGELTEDNRQKYLPQLVAQAEYQIGLALMPKLNEEQAEEMGELMEAGDVTPEQWQNFWRLSVPDYDQVVQKVMEDFGKQCQQILKK